MKEESIENQAALFSVLADPTRLRLFRLLCQQKPPGALCVNALASLLGVTQSAVSQHLRILKSVELVKGERRGYHIHYFVNAANLGNYQRLIAGIFETREPDNESCQDYCPDEKGTK